MEKRKKETQASQVARLSATAEGKALLDLVYSYPRKKDLADELGVSCQCVTGWINTGRTTMVGAELIERKLGKPKEVMRPDVSDWSKPQKGRMPGLKEGAYKPRAGEQQKLIIELIGHFGSARKLGEAVGATRTSVAKWLNRDSIPYRQKLALLQLELPGDLAERLKT